MIDFKKIIKGKVKFNKYFIIFVFIFFLFITGTTYAYYAFQYENDSVITGNVISINVELDVQLVVGTNTKMVPLQNDALSNALIGKNSKNGACIDNVGNLSCQVYKITLTNNGSRIQHVNGIIELYSKNGSSNVYNNLKWRELSNTTTIKTNSIINDMAKSMLVSDLTMESKDVKTWYIAVWISEVDYDQKEFDKGLFEGTVTFEAGSIPSNVFAETIMAPNADSDASIDFSKTSVESDTNGIYLRSGTENYLYPIYYYRGDVNNNLIFANTCWKVVRTTETGGLKLIYNGTPIVTETGKSCDNTGEASQIGTKEFNIDVTSPAYVGYMYSNPYVSTYKAMNSITDTYYYGNDVTYSNGTYTLTNTITSSDWEDLYDNDGLKNNHYTCFSTGMTCSSVNYIYFTNSRRAYYITLSNGKKVEDALIEMLGADDENTSNYNTTSTTIKGNNTTEGTLDYWYYKNIELEGYKNYIEDTVWCNDRTIYQKNGWDPNGGSTQEYLYFGNYGRTYMMYEPNLICKRKIDRFTKNESNGNGDLEYPVGLLTADEIVLAGGINYSNDSYYLYTGANYWIGSPFSFANNVTSEFLIDGGGSLIIYGALFPEGVRPSISLKAGFNLTGNGDGSVSNPYVVG